jgi:hypothetical protein
MKTRRENLQGGEVTGIPYWAIVIIIVVLVVGYYLLTASGREKRRESVGTGLAKIPNFHANQAFTDVRGETAIGIDDRGRRIAVSQRRAQPRTKVYSFAHIVSAEVIQNGAVIAKTAKKSPVAAREAATRTSAEALDEPPGGAPPEGAPGGAAPPGETPPAEPATGSLFGSTSRAAGHAPSLKPVLGSMTALGVRIVLEDPSDPGVLIRFYDGKPIDPFSVAGEKAFADARLCLGALDMAIKRAGLPPRPAISGSGLGQRP